MGEPIDAVGTNLMLSKSVDGACISVLAGEEQELPEASPVQQVSIEQSIALGMLTVEAGFEGLFEQQLFLEQSSTLARGVSVDGSTSLALLQHSSALATADSATGIEILLLQQLFLEQSSTILNLAGVVESYNVGG